MSDDRTENAEESGNKGVFDLFEPPPDIDPNRFGPIPVVPESGESTADAVDSTPDTDPPDIDLSDGDTPSGEASITSIFGFDPIDEADTTDTAPEAPAMLIDDLADEDIDSEIVGDTAGDLESEAADDVAGDSPVADADIDRHASGEHDIVSDMPETEGSELPHWTAPATGLVPKVIGGDRDSVEGWSEVSGPRWHGEGPQWAGDDLEAVFADEDGVGGPKRIAIDDPEMPDLPGAAGSPQRPESAAARAAQRPVVEVDGGRNLGQAIGVGVAFAAIAAAAFWLGNATTLALIVGIVVFAAVEVFGAMRKAGLHPATLLGIVASAALPLAAYHRGHEGFTLVMALAVVACALWYLSGADTQRPAVNVGLTMLGITWIGGLAAFASFILLSAGGVEVLLAAVVITVASDTGAFVGGKAIGSTPFHSASPNKTWEGTIVGLIAAVVAGLVIGLLELSVFSGSLTDAVLLGLTCGILAPIGDLTESMVKRDLGVKDMGTLLPGHGGFLDRIDGLLFVLPGAYYLGNVMGLL